jgi:hypothetical protein
MAVYTDSARLDALEKNLWFVEPDYASSGFRVGKVNKIAQPEHKDKTLRGAIDKAMRASAVPAGVDSTRGGER